MHVATEEQPLEKALEREICGESDERMHLNGHHPRRVARGDALNRSVINARASHGDASEVYEYPHFALGIAVAEGYTGDTHGSATALGAGSRRNVVDAARFVVPATQGVGGDGRLGNWSRREEEIGSMRHVSSYRKVGSALSPAAVTRDGLKRDTSWTVERSGALVDRGGVTHCS